MHIIGNYQVKTFILMKFLSHSSIVLLVEHGLPTGEHEDKE